MVRGMIENFTRDWVIRRRLSADFSSAPIHVTPSAGLRYLFRPMNSVDPSLLELVKEFVTAGCRRLGYRGKHRPFLVCGREHGRIGRACGRA